MWMAASDKSDAEWSARGETGVSAPGLLLFKGE